MYAFSRSCKNFRIYMFMLFCLICIPLFDCTIAHAISFEPQLQESIWTLADLMYWLKLAFFWGLFLLIVHHTYGIGYLCRREPLIILIPGVISLILYWKS